MERLWAPWRMEYIKGPKDGACIFCAVANGGSDWVVHRGERCGVMLNAYPYTTGHLMVFPYRHVGSLGELDDAEGLELFKLTQDALAALHASAGPHGFNVGVNLGKVAGAGFADHIHEHVVPRWDGDNNFMPVVGGARMLNQALEDALAAIRAAWPD